MMLSLHVYMCAVVFDSANDCGLLLNFYLFLRLLSCGEVVTLGSNPITSLCYGTITLFQLAVFPYLVSDDDTRNLGHRLSQCDSFLYETLWCSALKHSDSCADANLARQVPKKKINLEKNCISSICLGMLEKLLYKSSQAYNIPILEDFLWY